VRTRAPGVDRHAFHVDLQPAIAAGRAGTAFALGSRLRQCEYRLFSPAILVKRPGVFQRVHQFAAHRFRCALVRVREAGVAFQRATIALDRSRRLESWQVCQTRDCRPWMAP
jgi:hypothetical protein